MAGAGGVANSLVLDLQTLPVGPFTLPDAGCNLGRSDAGRLARSNGAVLTSYCYDWRTDHATAMVRSRKALQDGQHSKATATAATGVPWRRCVLDNLPSDSPTPTPSPTGTAKPSPTPTPSARPVQLVCGSITIEYELGPKGRLVLKDPNGLRALLTARLVH